jgi:hypothetical protein
VIFDSDNFIAHYVNVYCNTYYITIIPLQTKNSTWLLLLYGLPAKGNTARVTLWRKLKKYGAVQLKASAYVLPNQPEHYERFQWLATEIKESGGEATLIRVAQIEGMGDEQIIRMFNEARAAEYKELSQACQQLLNGRNKQDTGEIAAEFGRQQRRFRQIREADYFKSPAADDAQMILRRLEKILTPKGRASSQPKLAAKEFRGRTWLTRPRPGIDRAGSAWLIRKFIDPKAKFVFGTEPSSDPKALPFDMADVEFSHHGEDCTFETLVKRFGIADKAVQKMAEMVHDADLEDEKFQRTECVGIGAVLSGWARTKMSDAELLAKGMECFEGLYEQLQK